MSSITSTGAWDLGPALRLINSERAAPHGADALADVDIGAAWFAAVAERHGRIDLGDDRSVDVERLDALRLMRGAVGQILLGSPRASALSVVNRYDTEYAPSWGLELDASGRAVARRRAWGSGVESWLGAVAGDCIDLVRTGNYERIRTCATPGCAMVFLPQHHRRRYCTPACAHRFRQARYVDRYETGSTRPDA